MGTIVTKYKINGGPIKSTQSTYSNTREEVFEMLLSKHPDLISKPWGLQFRDGSGYYVSNN